MSWSVRAPLLWPERIGRNLERVRSAGLVERTPTPWQLSLGVLRMGHRLLFRSDTVGTSRTRPVRSTWRARALKYRAVRFPFLLAERAIAPLDLSGLASSPERIVQHLLAAHHDQRQFAYDLQLLRCYPGSLERLQALVEQVVRGKDPRSRWLRDLTVYEGYHEELLTAVTHAVVGEFALTPAERADPDISFVAYLNWCAAQPATLRQTLAAWLSGELSFAPPAAQGTAR